MVGVYNLLIVLGGGGGGVGFIIKFLYFCKCFLCGNFFSFFIFWFLLMGFFLGFGLLLFGEIDIFFCLIVLKLENGIFFGFCFWGDFGDG